MPQANCRLAAIALAALIALSLEPASAEGDAARRARDISSHTMSPFCPGRTLASCSSPEAAKWRQDVRRWVDEGIATPEIRARLELRVPGEDLSGAPPTPGGWILPLALTAASALVLLVLLVRLRRRAPRANGHPSETAPERSEIDRRLDAELTRLDE